MLRSLCVPAALLLGAVAALVAQDKYSGPRPPKSDIPYILHASNLVETEIGEAREEKTKKEAINWVAGVASPVRTPLAEPILLLVSEKLQPDKLELFQVQVRNGRREIAFPLEAKRAKDAPRPKHTLITRLAPGLFRIEANEPLDNGEYCLSPSGAMQVFCFQIY